MNRLYIYKGVAFCIANYTPRKNEYEKGLKYRLFVDDIATSFCFDTIKGCKDFIHKNYYIWL